MTFTATDPSGRSLGIIHRDVSPANILIDLHGLARIADFGIAKAADRRTQTQPGIYKGRYAYSAPERLMAAGGTGAEDHRADIFSVGAIMWEALTGQPLFRGTSMADTIYRVTDMKVPKPSRTGLRPPKELDAICLKALARDPNKRYGSAAEMAKDLRLVAAKLGLDPHPELVGRWITPEIRNQVLAKRDLIHDISCEDSQTRTYRRPSSPRLLPASSSTPARTAAAWAEDEPAESSPSVPGAGVTAVARKRGRPPQTTEDLPVAESSIQRKKKSGGAGWLWLLAAAMLLPLLLSPTPSGCAQQVERLKQQLQLP